MVFRCMYLSRAHSLAEGPFSEVGMGSIVSGLSPVQQLSAKGCLWWLSAGSPTTALSDSLSFTLPGALHVLEALIGPELDCGERDYWCQCVQGHVGHAGAPRAKPGPARSGGSGVGWGSAGLRSPLELHFSVLVTQSVNTTCPHILYT